MQLGRHVSIGESSLAIILLTSRCLIWNRFMGAMTNNGRKLANFAGFYK
jgi:hypothetical protein